VALDAQKILAKLDTKESELAPILTPTVANNPILKVRGFVVAPTHYAYAVIVRCVPIDGGISYDSSLVALQWSGIHRRLDRSPHKNFCHDGKDSVVLGVTPVFGDRSIGEVFDGITGAFALGMGRIGARSTRVHSAAGGIDVRTKSVKGIFRTGYVRKACIVGNPKGRPMDEFVGSNGRTTVAAPGLLAAVE